MIKINNLTKKYGKKIILENITLNINSGKTGIIGVNGAGKTTLANCIAGLTNYSGSIVTNKELGYCFSDNILPEYVSIYEIIQTLNWSEEKLDSLLNKLYCFEYKYEIIKNLSYGNKKKMNIIATLFLDNDVLIFDELTNGLDVNAQINLINILNDDPRDMLIISHDFNILNKVCSNFILINECKASYLDTKKESLEKIIIDIVSVTND